MDNLRTDNDNFAASRECFTEALGWLEGPDAAALSHAELEDQLDARGRELLRRMFQDHLSLRAMTERRLAGVRDAQARAYGAVEAGHHRRLATVFGEVGITRLAYRRRGQRNLYPADAALNVPAGRGADRPGRGRRQGVLCHPSSPSRSRRRERPAGHLCRWQGHRDATRRAAPSHRESGRCCNQQADVPVVQGREVQPQTPRRGRRVYDLTPVARIPSDVLASKAGESPPPAPKACAKW